MAAAGSVLVTLSLVLTSLSGEFNENGNHRPVYYQVLLSQGLLAGLCMSLFLVPSTAIVSTYFSEHRSLAVGLANTGASVGGIVYPIATRRLLVQLNFHWAMRVTALVVFVTSGVGALLLQQRRRLAQPATKRILYDFRCLREPSYVLFVLGMALVFAGSYIPYFYLSLWVRDTNFPSHGLESYYFLSILNAGGLVGRIVPSLLAGRVTSGPALVQSIAAVGCAALATGWTYIKTSFHGLVIWSLAYGFLSGSVISLIPATAASLTKDVGTLGGRLGIVFGANAMATLIGNPIAGVILGSMGDAWRGIAFYCTALNLAGGGLLGWCWKSARAGHT